MAAYIWVRGSVRTASRVAVRTPQGLTVVGHTACRNMHRAANTGK